MPGVGGIALPPGDGAGTGTARPGDSTPRPRGAPPERCVKNRSVRRARRSHRGFPAGGACGTEEAVRVERGGDRDARGKRRRGPRGTAQHTATPGTHLLRPSGRRGRGGTAGRAASPWLAGGGRGRTSSTRRHARGGKG